MSDFGGAAGRRIAQRAFDLAARLGIEEVEVALVETVSTKVSVADGRLESVEERQEAGIGLRVFHRRRTGFAFTADPGDEALARALEIARDLAELGEAEEANRAPDPAPLPEALPPNEDPALAAFPVARKIALAREVELAARAAYPEVDRIRRASYQDARGTQRIVSTRGVDAAEGWTRAWLSIEAAARRGNDQRIGWWSDWALGPGPLDPERVGRTGAARAVELLGARPGPTGRLPVVLPPEETAALLSALGDAFSGLKALRHRTVLEGREGQRIGSSRVTLVDDGTLPGTWGTGAIDGEGLPTRRNVLVEEGIFRGFLHDSYTARRFGLEPTGNSLRGGYAAPPTIGAHALHLLPTGPGRMELLARAEGGILVSELMGLHTVNTVTGDFSLGAAGRRIGPGGEPAEPLDRMAISGSILDLFSAVEAVADDLQFFIGGAGGATVLLGEMAISGS